MIPNFLVNFKKFGVSFEGNGISTCFRNIQVETNMWAGKQKEGFSIVYLSTVLGYTGEKTLQSGSEDPESETAV